MKSGADCIDAGATDTVYAATDIFGVARPVGTAYDIGAAEFTNVSGVTLYGLYGFSTLGTLLGFPNVLVGIQGNSGTGGFNTPNLTIGVSATLTAVFGGSKVNNAAVTPGNTALLLPSTVTASAANAPIAMTTNIIWQDLTLSTGAWTAVVPLKDQSC